jgi:TonB family protein
MSNLSSEHAAVSAYPVNRPLILLVVLFAHAGLLLLLIEISQAYQLESPISSPPIQVRLLTLSKAEKPTQQSSATAPATSPVTSIGPGKAKPQSAQPKILALKQPSPSLQPVPDSAITSATPATIDSPSPAHTTPQVQPMTPVSGHAAQHSSHAQSTAGAATQHKATDTGAEPQVQAQPQQARLGSTSPTSMEHVPVSRVEVLSMGLIQYNDRDLQQQNRDLVLTIYIDAQGKTKQVLLKDSTGLDYLDQMVIKAALKAKFKPHVVAGQAVAVKVEFPFQLKLSQR